MTAPHIYVMWWCHCVLNWITQVVVSALSLQRWVPQSFGELAILKIGVETVSLVWAVGGTNMLLLTNPHLYPKHHELASQCGRFRNSWHSQSSYYRLQCSGQITTLPYHWPSTPVIQKGCDL